MFIKKVMDKEEALERNQESAEFNSEPKGKRTESEFNSEKEKVPQGTEFDSEQKDGPEFNSDPVNQSAWGILKEKFCFYLL